MLQISAIVYHRNDVFDWLFENTDYLQPNQSLDDFLNDATCNLNAHVISRIVETTFNIKKVDYSKIIKFACSNGFYRLLLYMSKLNNLNDYFNPSISELKYRYENEDNWILTHTINDEDH